MSLSTTQIKMTIPHYKLSDFDFDLPESLIAQTPCPNRSQSRLLAVEQENSFLDLHFLDIIKYFQAGDVLILNNTKVIPARLYGQKLSGGKLEIFVERIQSETKALCMIKANHPPKPGQSILIGQKKADILEKEGQFYLLELQEEAWEKLINEQGSIPLPPYIQRQSNQDDLERYQTVYAKHSGAVAAPTAGLHFDQALLDQLKNKGVEILYITLHVGAGTFLPVKTENITDHQMHFERYFISDKVAEKINLAKQQGRRITAVGTTSLRTLESAATNREIITTNGDTNLFIYPGFQFQIVDRLITNFHLPKSSLMLLVSAFSGYNSIFSAYKHAIMKKYRFFSYGDAMLLTCSNYHDKGIL